MLIQVCYTYAGIVTTLCMVEEPGTHQYVAVHTHEPDSNSPPPYTPPTQNKTGLVDTSGLASKDVETEFLSLRTKPITASLRGTIMHLRTYAGCWSRYRGLSAFLCMLIAQALIRSAISAIPGLRTCGGVAIATVLAQVVLARWHMTWIHIVISQPSQKRWYQRLPALKTWTKIAPAVALEAVVVQIVLRLPVLVSRTFGPMHMSGLTSEPDERHIHAHLCRTLIKGLVFLSLYVLLAIPAEVTLVRVAASMLPEEDEAIVPFDRTFGGKVVTTIAGGSGRIGMLDAWRTFGWPSRKRLLKLLVKVCAFILAVKLFFALVIVADAYLFLGGDKLKEILEVLRQRSGH